MQTTIALLSGLSLSSDHTWLLLLALLSVALLAGIAYHWPTLTMVLFLLLGPLWDVLLMTPEGAFNQGINVAAVRPVDALLVAMMAAATARGIALALAHRGGFPAALRWTLGLLGLWILFEIGRNVAAYGLSAPGEFRYTYLPLVMPVYVAVSFTTTEQQRRLLKSTVLVATVVTLCFVPVIGTLKGWGVGPESRFLPAGLSLGLVLGWVALFLAVRAGALRISMTLVWLLALPVAALVVVDGHRSVWLVLLAVTVVLFVIGELGLARVWGWTVPVGAVAGLVLVGVLAAGIDLVPYVSARSQAFTAPQNDATASWRITQWEAQLRVWRQSPIVGEGFGGYWAAGEQYGSASVSPHNLYVQTLVRLGVVGLALLLSVAASVAVLLARALARFRRQGRRDELEYVLVVMGLVALVAVCVYGVAYALDYYALLFVGLGIAASVDDARPSSPTPSQL